MLSNTTDKKRVKNLDIARTFAILSVVLCHSIENVYANIARPTDTSQIFRFTLYTIGRLGVPIFLLLTGALVLQKQIEDDEDVNKFYKKNLLPLFITVEVWNVLYNIFLSFMKKDFSITEMLQNIIFLKNIDMANMWYMPMILGIYVAIPFVAKIVKTFSLKSLQLPMALTFIASILVPSINKVIQIFDIGKFEIILDLSFLGGAYGLYILIGYYINCGILKKYSCKQISLLAIGSFIITVIFQYFRCQFRPYYFLWYDFITLFICSILLFELFTRIKDEENIFTKITEYISKISLGIFFVNELFLKIFAPNIIKTNLNEPIKTIILFALPCTCSIIFVYLTSKIKFIKQKIYLIKN